VATVVLLDALGFKATAICEFCASVPVGRKKLATSRLNKNATRKDLLDFTGTPILRRVTVRGRLLKDERSPPLHWILGGKLPPTISTAGLIFHVTGVELAIPVSKDDAISQLRLFNN
jgi:hypothetical protein